MHHWLFNKIRLVEEREKAVFAELEKRFGEGTAAIRGRVEAEYGSHFDGAPLDTIIGETSLNDFLSGAIETVETREAALLAAVVKAHGEEARQAAIKASCNHGRQQGRSAVEEYQVEDPTPEDVYKIVKNYFLDGMPSDHVIEIEHNADSAFIERHTACLHRPHWEKAGAGDRFMCEYVVSWLRGFTSAFKGMRHRLPKARTNGDGVCEYVFEKEA